MCNKRASKRDERMKCRDKGECVESKRVGGLLLRRAKGLVVALVHA